LRKIQKSYQIRAPYHPLESFAIVGRKIIVDPHFHSFTALVENELPPDAMLQVFKDLAQVVEISAHQLRLRLYHNS
jgi:hypothetical protein